MPDAIPVTDAESVSIPLPPDDMPPMPEYLVVSYNPRHKWSGDLRNNLKDAERCAKIDVDIGATIVRVFRLPGGGA